MKTRVASSVALSALVLLGFNRPVAALTMEEAQTNCRATVGTPFVRACMGGRRGDGPELEACRAKASPQVRACVTAAMNKANGRANVAVAVGTKKEAAPIGNALPAGFVPPPRSIADISAMLDNEKPDAAKLAQMKEDAEEEPDAKLGARERAEFYYDRANTRSSLGRYPDAMADARKALPLAISAGEPLLGMYIRQFIALMKNGLGDPNGSMNDFVALARDTDNRPGIGGFVFNANRNAMQAMVAVGDIQAAEGLLRQVSAKIVDYRTSGLPGKREGYAQRGRNWEAEFNASRAVILEARGQYREAETAYKLASDYKRAAVPDQLKLDYSSPEEQMLRAIDQDLMNVARMKARQGRLAEAEVDARAVLISRLKADGKYNPSTPKFIMGLANILIDQGRHGDAEKLIRASLEINRSLGIGDDTQNTATILSQLGAILTFQRKNDEAKEVYAQLDKAMAKWEAARRQTLELNGSRISALFASGQLDAGIAAAQSLLAREVKRVGDKHFDTAAARGTYAMGLALAGRDADAIREFKTALPVLMAASRESADDDDDSTVSAARTERLQAIVESYIGVRSKSHDDAAGGDVALETFALADVVRGHAVQKALAASSARSAVKDPALVELVRKEQDAGKQINALLGALNNALASNVRDDKVIAGTNAAVDKLRSDREKTRAEITRRFPDYADLVDPKPPTVAQIQASLAPGESLLSFYFGRQASFVWAVPKQGPVAFSAIPASGADIQRKVYKLREALEPQAAMVSDIPAFDVALGHELYSLLLKPVEGGWKSAQNLIVVTNGALGLLPLSLLPTAPAEPVANDEPLFDSYKKVAWLARTHAVTMVPSASALRTLRQLPPGKTSRGELIAFGDPYFSKEQAAEAADPVKVADASTTTRGLSTRGMPLKRRNAPQLDGVDSAELALLPRLPDTADELKLIAVALQADPDKVLNLGKDANEKKVKSTDLSGFKVVAFATHGLVPGELNGLTQPALALSAPGVADTDGDGLLTMEEILTLKLDADWVVLSACNTGAGSGAGAEAASGLGRAFFYAGTRALLVTNWSVHSQSARELVADLFKRQADDPKLTRGEALRQAMMALADGKGFTDDDGKTLFSYAHPLFWAPYTIIGDGGRK